MNKFRRELLFFAPTTIICFAVIYLGLAIFKASIYLLFPLALIAAAATLYALAKNIRRA